MTAQIDKMEIGNLVIEGIPHIPKQLSEKLNQYQNTREAFIADWLADGSGMLILTRFGESAQVHLVKYPGGIRKQLTFFNDPISAANVCPSPEKNGFLFTKDKGGSEVYQLYYFDIDKGHFKLLTDGYSKNGNGIWNNQGNAFVYPSIKRNDKDYDIYLFYPDEAREERRILKGKGLWFPIQWSADDRYITLGHFRSINECLLYYLEVETGELTAIATEPNVASQGGEWTKSGNGVYFTSDQDSQFRQLFIYDLKNDSKKNLSPEIDWNVEMHSLSPDGDTLAFTVNENGISRLFLLDTETYQYQPIETIPNGQISGLKWHPQGLRLALSLNTPISPADVYVLDVNSQDIEQWTFSEVGGLNKEIFIEPDLIHYPTFDAVNGSGRHIPAFYYRPAQQKKPHPVLIYIHGGPESQYRPAFSSIFQYYLNELGIAVIAPNVRGSTGYGKSFLKLDNGYKREDSVFDIGKLIDWIDCQPELDSERIAVIGGSYGGYMVLASMTHYNDRLRCGIDIVGISNFVTFLENTKSYRRNLRRVEYGDERDPKMREHLENISPTSNAHKITKPMLIVQGLNDPRVPASEAEQMLKKIRKNGSEAWYLLAKDEGHGFRKKFNRDYYNKAVILFLQKYLLE